VSTGIEVALLVLMVIGAVSIVSLPILRPPANVGDGPALAAREQDRARLFAALEELGRDLKAGMISQADYAAAVGDIRRRLSRL